MVRVSRSQAAENREAVIDAASRLFRERGFDGIGIKDVMESAGLTQGAFYKQFASKQDLVANASKRAFESASSSFSAVVAANPEDPFGTAIAYYLSMEHRDDRLGGCPIVGLAAEAARQGSDVKASFEAGITALLEVLVRLIAGAGGKEADDKALAVLSTMVGAMTLARAINDADLAKAFLDAAARQCRATVATQKTETRRSPRPRRRPGSATNARSRKK